MALDPGISAVIVGALVFAAQVLTLWRTKKVYHLVNRNYSDQRAEIATLRKKVEELEQAARALAAEIP